MDQVTSTVLGGLDLFALMHIVFWHVIRIGAAIQVSPVFGGSMMPTQVRMIFTIALAAAVSQMLPAPPAAGFDSVTVLSVLREFAVGIAMGTIIRLAFEAGRLAGELISQSMALSLASMADPLTGASSTVLSQWFFIAFGLLFFAFDGHLAMVQMLVESYHLLPIGTALPDPMAVASAAPEFFSTALRVGVLLALPVMLAMLTVNIAFGVLARAASQLNPIALGLPVALLVGLFLLGLVFSQLQAPVRDLFDAAFQAGTQLVR